MLRKILLPLFINKFKSIFKLLIKSNSVFFSFDSISLKLKKNCFLGKKNQKIFVRFDQIITPNILRDGNWDVEIINFITQVIKKKNYMFIDVGANIGLITRQLFFKTKIKKFYCIEPEKINFELLSKNLSVIEKKKLKLFNFALTDTFNKKAKIYLDLKNSGNFSLLGTKGKNYNNIITKNINNFFSNINFSKNEKIIYKSDTQGYDEKLIMALNEKYLRRIDIMILEISNFNLNNEEINCLYRKFKNFNSISTSLFKSRLDIDKFKYLLKLRREFNLFLHK